jgi:uncharacterized membrane protein YgdD (TMEM256/DUF423 family)
MSGWAWIRVGAICGFLGVGLGAFGAHGLKATLETLKTAANFQTASQYHMYHALALVAVGLLSVSGRSGTAVSVAGWSFLGGILLFSGSLYALAITGNTKLGMITPIGGVLFLVGWVALAIASGSGPKP